MSDGWKAPNTTAFKGSDALQVRQLIESLEKYTASAALPTGVIMPFAGDTAPEGWLLCDGSAVSRTQYRRLFEVIGTAYGAGDGTDTFNVPDLRGRVPVGLDNMGGSLAGRLTGGTTRGGAGGSQSMPAHSHSWGPLFAFTTGSGVLAVQLHSAGADDVALQDTSTVGAGNGGNMPPYQLVNYIIRI